MAILPPTPLPKKSNRCHHFGQHYEIYIMYNTSIYYNTTSKYINSDTCTLQWENILVHQSLVHKLLPKNYHKESLITSRCHIFLSFYFPTNQFGIRNYKITQMNLNITYHFTHFNLAPNNLIMLTCHDN